MYFIFFARGKMVFLPDLTPLSVRNGQKAIRMREFRLKKTDHGRKMYYFEGYKYLYDIS